MESQRRQRQTSQPAPQTPGWREWAQRWGNTLLTVLLVVVIGSLVIRWRAVHAAQARLGVVSQLAAAESAVQSLASENPNRPPASLAQSRLNTIALASDGVAAVLNSTDDAALRAQAVLTQGDLNWHLANLPALPGAATQPALQPTTPPDQALDHAASSYQQVLDSYPAQHEAVTAARFGLAAVAENRRDWPAAHKQLQAILDDPSAQPALQSQAQRELALLPALDKQLYFNSGPTTPAPAPPGVSTSEPAASVTIPGLDSMLHTAASTASTQPATSPSIGPLPLPKITPSSAPPSAPTTGVAAPPVVQPAPQPSH